MNLGMQGNWSKTDFAFRSRLASYLLVVGSRKLGLAACMFKFRFLAAIRYPTKMCVVIGGFSPLAGGFVTDFLNLNVDR